MNQREQSAKGQRERESNEWTGKSDYEGDRDRERETEKAWRRRREEGQKASFVSSSSAAVLSSLFNMLFHLQPCRDKDREERRGEEERRRGEERRMILSSSASLSNLIFLLSLCYLYSFSPVET